MGRKSQRAGFGRPWESSERVTLPVLIGFIVFSAFLCLIGTLVWEGVFRAEPPTVVAALFPIGLLVFWLSPLAIWVLDAVEHGGILRWERLNASTGAVLSWGGVLGLLLPLGPGHHHLGQRATIGIVSAACTYAALRFLDRVTVAHAALGLAGAAATGWCAARATGALAAALHRAHLAGHLTGVRAEWLPTWIAGGAVVTGVAITVALQLRSGRRATRSSGRWTPSIAVVPPAAPPAASDEPSTFLLRAGAGADALAREFMRQAERARRGGDAERDVARELDVLGTRGWSLEANVFIRGARIGDIDILATGPSGQRYAIDVKSSACTVRYDSERRELVLWYGRGRKDTVLLATARRQKLVLQAHGHDRVVPVLCFTRAAIGCADVVDGVVVIASRALLSWLEATDAQARSAEVAGVEQG